MKDRQKYEDFLIWFVTPQSDEEAAIFKEEGFVDDYIDLANRIPSMSDKQLLDELDNQLVGYGKVIDRNHDDFK